MKKLPLIFATSLLVLFSFCCIILNSCKKKDIEYNDTTLIRPCEGVICLNGAACSDGVCVCPLGYEGEKCQIKWSDKFTGSYTAVDDCNVSGNPSYMVNVTPHPDYAYKMRLYNLGVVCAGKIVDAVINPEKTSFLIPLQNTCNKIYLSGYGNMNGDFVNIYLTSRDTVAHTGTQCSIILAKNP